jgi:pyridinium-3,5-biscarboxylic acid mononucleotide sulfurtransferase
MNAPLERQATLVATLDRHDEIAVAASGGVDSMVLAYVAHRFSRAKVVVMHAVSPAVPLVATQRVREHAHRHGWNLRLLDAGEMADPDYLRNPVDRCFHCKKNLYGRIAGIVGGTIASGTNLDDLSDFRPGLEAARNHGVVHPYVEAGFAKADIYDLARAHGLDDLAALPAQPCLSSRIETGIGVDREALHFIERAEAELAARLPGRRAIRCRITAKGVFLALDVMPEGAHREEIEAWAREFCRRHGREFAGLRPYRQGAAFLRKVTA